MFLCFMLCHGSGARETSSLTIFYFTEEFPRLYFAYFPVSTGSNEITYSQFLAGNTVNIRYFVLLWLCCSVVPVQVGWSGGAMPRQEALCAARGHGKAATTGRTAEAQACLNGDVLFACPSIFLIYHTTVGETLTSTRSAVGVQILFATRYAVSIQIGHVHLQRQSSLVAAWYLLPNVQETHKGHKARAAVHPAHPRVHARCASVRVPACAAMVGLIFAVWKSDWYKYQDIRGRFRIGCASG